jgi:hypothetical protein
MAGVDGTVDGVVDGILLIGKLTAGGGNSGAGGIGGNSRGLSAPGGVVLGVGALETSGDERAVDL